MNEWPINQGEQAEAEHKWKPNVEVLKSTTDSIGSISQEEAGQLYEEFFQKVGERDYQKAGSRRKEFKNMVKTDGSEDSALDVIVEEVKTNRKMFELDLYDDLSYKRDLQRPDREPDDSLTGQDELLCLTVPQIMKFLNKHSSEMAEKKDNFYFMVKSTNEKSHEIFTVHVSESGHIYLRTKEMTMEQRHKLAPEPSAGEKYTLVYPASFLDGGKTEKE